MADKQYKYKGWIIYVEDTGPRVSDVSLKDYDIKIWKENNPERWSDVNKHVPHAQLEAGIEEAKKLILELSANKKEKPEKPDKKPYSQASIELLDEIISNAEFLKDRLLKGKGL